MTQSSMFLYKSIVKCFLKNLKMAYFEKWSFLKDSTGLLPVSAADTTISYLFSDKKYVIYVGLDHSRPSVTLASG
jgi:hypothetical protein